MVAAFIRDRGVTVCPPFGSPELAALNVERERAYRDGNWKWGGRSRKRKRRAA